MGLKPVGRCGCSHSFPTGYAPVAGSICRNSVNVKKKLLMRVTLLKTIKLFNTHHPVSLYDFFNGGGGDSHHQDFATAPTTKLQSGPVSYFLKCVLLGYVICIRNQQARSLKAGCFLAVYAAWWKGASLAHTHEAPGLVSAPA